MPERNMDDEGWLVGAAMLLCGIGLFGVQIYWFLQSGQWTPLSIIDSAQMLVEPTKWPWVFAPQSWMGFHAVLDWLSLPGLLAVWGFIVMAASRHT
jgi:hypothetical protein